MADLVRPSSEAIVARPLARELVEEAAQNARRSLSEATQRAYAADWRRFSAWCAAHALTALPADEPTIATYLTAAAAGYELDGVPVLPLGYGSIARLYSAIRVQHDEAGHALPRLRGVVNTLHALGRKLGVAPKHPKKALTREQIRAAVRLLTPSAADARARAVLLFGWIIGQRRRDIAALRVGDVAIDEEGVTVILRKTKTDQLGKGRVLAVTRRGGPCCAVTALETWLAIRKPEGDRALLLGVSAVTVNAIVKRAAASLGLDAREYGGHSLRRGFVTSAARAGCDVAAIMGVTGHEDVKQVLGYIEDATPFKRDIGSALLADDGDENEMPKKPLREYVPPVEDKGLKATIGELAGPVLVKQRSTDEAHVVVPEPAYTHVDWNTGAERPLVDRRAAQAMRRRVVTRPDFTRDGAPCDVAWLVKQAHALYAKGRSRGAILAAFKAIGVLRGSGEQLEVEDIKRWLAT